MKKFSNINESITVEDLNRLMTEKISELLSPVNPKEVKAFYVTEIDAKNRDENDHGLNIIVIMSEEPLDQCIEEIQEVKKIVQKNFKIKRDTLRSHNLIKIGTSLSKYYEIYFLISEEDMLNNNIFKSVVGINKFRL